MAFLLGMLGGLVVIAPVAIPVNRWMDRSTERASAKHHLHQQGKKMCNAKPPREAKARGHRCMLARSHKGDHVATRTRLFGSERVAARWPQ